MVLNLPWETSMFLKALYIKVAMLRDHGKMVLSKVNTNTCWMLLEHSNAKLPNQCWGECILTSTYPINHIPRSSLSINPHMRSYFQQNLHVLIWECLALCAMLLPLKGIDQNLILVLSPIFSLDIHLLGRGISCIIFTLMPPLYLKMLFSMKIYFHFMILHFLLFLVILVQIPLTSYMSLSWSSVEAEYRAMDVAICKII